MELYLIDNDPDLVSEWKVAFKGFPEVHCQLGNILDFAEGAIVSPANSFGHMDGGIDLAYYKYFGDQMQQNVFRMIERRPEGLLPVGASEIVATGDTRIPYLVVAPTMEIPEPVPASHCYRAMRAVLRTVFSGRTPIHKLYCPGLATGVGQVPPDQAAKEMARAWGDMTNR